MSGDGAAASKKDDEEEQADQDLERVQLTATGIEPVENGAADVTHGAECCGRVTANATGLARSACAPHLRVRSTHAPPGGG